MAGSINTLERELAIPLHYWARNFFSILLAFMAARAFAMYGLQVHWSAWFLTAMAAANSVYELNRVRVFILEHNSISVPGAGDDDANNIGMVLALGLIFQMALARQLLRILFAVLTLVVFALAFWL